MLGSGNNLSRGTVGLSSDTPNLSQVLTLEPIRLDNQSYTRSGELRRVLGVPSREASSEDTSFGMSHPKPSPPVATEELKQFKESVLDTSREAGYGVLFLFFVLFFSQNTSCLFIGIYYLVGI